jgi:hypothetical protein
MSNRDAISAPAGIIHCGIRLCVIPYEASLSMLNTLIWHCPYRLPLQHTMASCRIQWLYLAVHGCKTYLNLNLSETCPVNPHLMYIGCNIYLFVYLFVLRETSHRGVGVD